MFNDRQTKEKRLKRPKYNEITEEKETGTEIALAFFTAFLFVVVWYLLALIILG